MAIKNVPENILNRIKKCLALSRSNFENEAATAMRMATQLMQEYGLEMSQLDVDAAGHIKEERMGEDIGRLRDMFPWEKSLAGVPTYLMPVSCFFQPGHDYGYSIVYVGSKSDAALATAVYELLRSELLRVSKDEETPRARRAFLVGCVGVLAGRAYDLKKARQAPQPSAQQDPGKALMVVKDKQVELYMKSKYKLKPTVTRGSAQDLDAYIRGQKAGHKIGLDFDNKLTGGPK